VIQYIFPSLLFVFLSVLLYSLLLISSLWVYRIEGRHVFTCIKKVPVMHWFHLRTSCSLP